MARPKKAPAAPKTYTEDQKNAAMVNAIRKCGGVAEAKKTLARLERVGRLMGKV